MKNIKFKKIISIFAAVIFLMSFAFASESADVDRVVYEDEENEYGIATGISTFLTEDEPVEAAAILGSAPTLRVPSAILIDQTTGTVLFEKDADTKRPPASVTKVMTLLLIMEAISSGKIKLTDMVTCSAEAASMGGSQVWLEPGEQMSVDEMLKCITVASANDCCVAMAELIAGSHEGFVAMMNNRAKELGMLNTTFINCTGLDADGHLTTARDIALMTRELAKHKKIFEYTTIWIDTVRNGQFGLANTNKLVRFYSGATGMKTGSTSKARFCLSATAERDNLPLIAVVMAGETSDERFSDTKKLLDYGFANWAYASDKEMAEKIFDIPVEKGKCMTVKAKLEKAPEFLVEKGNGASLEKTMTVQEKLEAPVIKGQTVGEVIYKIGGKELGRIKIITEDGCEKMGMWDYFSKIIQKLFMAKNN